MRHAGVMLPNGSVAHMTPGGAAIVSVEDFLQGRDIRFDKAAPVKCQRQIQWRAHQSVGRMPPYDLWNRNCEHYATWLMGEKPQSPRRRRSRTARYSPLVAEMTHDLLINNAHIKLPECHSPRPPASSNSPAASDC